MASLKETPRQKLIGMMYLVLLALLALQVSSAIMEKFKFLDDSLQQANSMAEKNNGNLEDRIATAVVQAGNKSADLAILEKARRIKKQSETVQQHISKLREELIAASGGFEDAQDKGSMYVGAKDEAPVEELMIAKKKAVELKTQVNAYCDELRKITGLPTEFPYIALDAKDDPRINKTSEQKKKTFAELNFAQTPMVAAMAVLSNMESDVLKNEAKALEFLADGLDSSSFHFDRVKAMFRAESNTIVAGRKYKAEVFLGASSSGLTPVIEIDGKKLTVNEDGIGNLEFTPQGGNYSEYGFANRKWNGKITYKKNGKDTTFPISGEYRVAKPFVEVQSDAKVQLYKNCGNELRVSCPPLGADFRPSYEGSTGGDVIPQNAPGKIMVIPTNPLFKLKVLSGGTQLDEKSYAVRLIPIPTFNLKNIDPKIGLQSPYPPRMCLEVIPDESFLKSNPQDARYKIAEVEVTLIRRKKSIFTKTFTNGCMDLGFLQSTTILPGDYLSVEVKKVLRANFRNEVEEVRIGRIIKNVPL
jgi:gliding motility-associated protein GldM